MSHERPHIVTPSPIAFLVATDEQAPLVIPHLRSLLLRHVEQWHRGKESSPPSRAQPSVPPSIWALMPRWMPRPQSTPRPRPSWRLAAMMCATAAPHHEATLPHFYLLMSELGAPNRPQSCAEPKT